MKERSSHVNGNNAGSPPLECIHRPGVIVTFRVAIATLPPTFDIQRTIGGISSND